MASKVEPNIGKENHRQEDIELRPVANVFLDHGIVVGISLSQRQGLYEVVDVTWRRYKGKFLYKPAATIVSSNT